MEFTGPPLVVAGNSLLELLAASNVGDSKLYWSLESGVLTHQVEAASVSPLLVFQDPIFFTV